MLNEFDMDKSYINDEYVAQLICPTDKSHFEVFDANLKGFYVDVQPSGHKCFRLRHRVKSKLRVTTLGNALLISADQARKMAFKVLAGQSFGHEINGIELMDSDQSSIAVLMGETLESFFFFLCLGDVSCASSYDLWMSSINVGRTERGDVGICAG